MRRRGHLHHPDRTHRGCLQGFAATPAAALGPGRWYLEAVIAPAETAVVATWMQGDSMDDRRFAEAAMSTTGLARCLCRQME